MFAYDSKFVFPVNSILHYTCNSHFVAYSDNGSDILIYDIYSSHGEKLTLTGHRGKITTLCFNDTNNGFLCSVAEEIILWRIADIKLSFLTRESVKGTTLSVLKNKISCLAFSYGGVYIAACGGKEVTVYSTNMKKLLKTVNHSGNVISLKFLSEILLISISEDKIIKIFDIKSNAIVSELKHEDDFISLETNKNTIVFGSSDGIIHIYEYLEDRGMSKLHEMDVKKHCNDKQSDIDIKDMCDPKPVLLIKYYNEDMCFIALPDIIIQMDTKTIQTKVIFKITDSLLSIDGESHYLTYFLQIKISKSLLPDKMIFVIMTKENEMCLISFWMEAKECCSDIRHDDKLDKMNHVDNDHDYPNDNHAVDETFCDNFITVISKEPLVTNSILKNELKLKTTPLTTKMFSTGLKQGNLDKRGKILDKQIIIFHKNIKSSGYIEKKSNKIVKKDEAESFKEELKFPSSQEFLPSASRNILDCSTVSFKTTLNVSGNSVINKMSFSGNGNMLLCSSANGIVSVLKRNKNSFYLEKAFQAHNHVINEIKFNNSGNLFITCGDDKKAFIFDSKKCSPVLTLDQKFGNIQSNDKPDKLIKFSGQIGHAQFYYMDKFIVLAHENELLLYSHHMDTVQHDLKRITGNSKYKLVHSTPTECKNVTSFSAINSFYSYIGLCCCSNKSICVVDFNVGSVIASFVDSHERCPHVIQQYKGSNGSPYSSSPNDLFITSAICDGIKLWDLRSQRCVNKFQKHKNRVHKCGATFSPSGKYITTGSEDGLVYIYDIRHGLMGHTAERMTDCLLCPQYDPTWPEVLYSNLTGQIITYKS